ncbi:hypothetical protein DV20_07650 [Amycolatopsis rifamycinica]|uniref:Uncharacterized protein n=1 Tax=Amycolatopsis rifamycinica TaxID=287986 RepID=A0A066UFF9_9PSEU|nr:hypothetical protein DV20_07650 [Amycolatopsis rifamycinica]
MKPTSLPTAFGWWVSVVSSGRSIFRALVFVCSNSSVSARLRRSHSPTRPKTPPSRNGSRQPHDVSCALSSARARTKPSTVATSTAEPVEM